MGNYSHNTLYALSEDKTYTCSYYQDTFGIKVKKNADSPRWDETVIDNKALTYTYMVDAIKSNSFYNGNIKYTRRTASWSEISNTIKSLNFMKVVVDTDGLKFGFYIH